MEFLVHVHNKFPADMPQAQRDRLRAAERIRGKELLAEGRLKRIWRVPGERANIALYEAAHATELHEILASLPMWPWLDMHVEPLAVHPLEQ